MEKFSVLIVTNTETDNACFLFIPKKPSPSVVVMFCELCQIFFLPQRIKEHEGFFLRKNKKLHYLSFCWQVGFSIVRFFERDEE